MQDLEEPTDAELELALNATQDLLTSIDVDGSSLVLASTFASVAPALSTSLPSTSAQDASTCSCRGQTADVCRAALRESPFRLDVC